MGKKSWLKSVRNVFKSSPSSKDSDKRVEWSSSEVAEEGEMPETVSVEHFPADTSVDGEADEEEREHAMVAAVEAAAVAARAAARVVRLAGYGRLSREDNAAVIVQSCYRGYLARKARRALRGLVRLQALARGHAVRKQAQMTMRCMQSLVRIQARARARRLSLMHNHTYEYLPCRRKRLYPTKDPYTIKEEEVNDDSCDDGGTYPTGNNKSPHIENRQGIVMESQRRHDNVVDQERALAYAFSCQERPQWGWNWLEHWVAAEHQLQSHDRSASLPVSSYATVPNAADNMSEKTVEIDTEPRKFSKRQFGRHEGAEERLTRMQHAVPSYMAATQSARAKARAHIKADGQRRAQSARRHSGYSPDSSCGGDDRTPPFVGGMMGRKERGGV